MKVLMPTKGTVLMTATKFDCTVTHTIAEMGVVYCVSQDTPEEA